MSTRTLDRTTTPVAEDALQADVQNARRAEPALFRRLAEPVHFRAMQPTCSTLASALRRLVEPTTPSPAASEVSDTDERVAEPDPADRRSLPRRASRASVRIALCRDNGHASEWALRSAPCCDVLDLTLSSLAFFSRDPIPASRRLVARLSRRVTGDELDVEGRVVRCRPSGDGHHVVVSFDRRITLEQVETFGRSVMESTLV